MLTQSIRQISAEEVAVLRLRWFRGATVIAYITHSENYGLGVVDPRGRIRAKVIRAAAEIPLAGFWNLQGGILVSPWPSHTGVHWSYVERRGSEFVLFDSSSMRTHPMPAEMIPRALVSGPQVISHGLASLAIQHRSSSSR